MRIDPFSDRLVALAPAENRKVVEQILRQPTHDGQSVLWPLTLPDDMREKNGITNAIFETYHHGDRVGARLTFNSGSVWSDGVLTVKGPMPETLMTGLVGCDLGNVVDCELFKGLEIIHAEACKNDAIRILTDLESTIRIVGSE